MVRQSAAPAPNPSNLKGGFNPAQTLANLRAKGKAGSGAAANPAAKGGGALAKGANRTDQLLDAVSKWGSLAGPWGKAAATAAKLLSDKRVRKALPYLLALEFIIVPGFWLTLGLALIMILRHFGDTPSGVAATPGAGTITASATCQAVQVREGTIYAPLDFTASATNRSGNGQHVANGDPTHVLELYLSGTYKNAPEGNYVSLASDINGGPNSYPRKPAATAYIPALEDKFGQPITFRIDDTGGDFGAWRIAGNPGPASRKNPMRISNPELFIDVAVYRKNYGFREVAGLISKGFTMYVEKAPGACVRSDSDTIAATGTGAASVKGTGVQNDSGTGNVGTPHFVDNVPGIRQSDGSECAAASSAMILAHYDASALSDSDIVKTNGKGQAMNAPNCPTPNAVIEKLKGRTGGSVTFKQVKSLTVDQVRKSIDGGDPVLVNTGGKTTAVGVNHMVVIVGYDDTHFYINDPYPWGAPESDLSQGTMHIYTITAHNGKVVGQQSLVSNITTAGAGGGSYAALIRDKY